jgi:hypothetical protein
LPEKLKQAGRQIIIHQAARPVKCDREMASKSGEEAVPRKAHSVIKSRIRVSRTYNAAITLGRQNEL